MPDGAARAILQHLGLAAGVPAATPGYHRTNGSTARLADRPTVRDSDGAPDWDRDPVVVSLARWDRIKDPLGILDGFLERVRPAAGAHLLLAGPDRARSPMTPKPKRCSPTCAAAGGGCRPGRAGGVMSPASRLPPLEQSAAMVNAIQRLAAVVVKKSLQEGFGLGVTEAMWKARPVVASAVGGNQEQVQHRHSGLLVEDPADIGAFGDAIVELLQEPPRAARLGQAARERARAVFLNHRHFVRWVEVFGSALDRGDHDAVTGLWNQRPFENELDRARQNAERIALLSIDVDRYNDVIQRHGAAAAQQLIQAVAHVLAERLRPNDTLARMGGDEFAAVFRHATPPLIQSLADGLCTAVREHSHATGTGRIPATISIGAALFDAGTQTHHEALRAADTALHQAKVAGGDRAIVHEPPQEG